MYGNRVFHEPQKNTIAAAMPAVFRPDAASRSNPLRCAWLTSARSAYRRADTKSHRRLATVLRLSSKALIAAPIFRPRTGLQSPASFRLSYVLVLGREPMKQNTGYSLNVSRTRMFTKAAVTTLFILASTAVSDAATITTFDVSGATGTLANGINAGGSITGYYYDTNNGLYSFVRAPDGTITTFGDVGTVAVSINASGSIAGTVSSLHGFIRSANGTITTFDVGKKRTYVTSINKGGSVTGFYCDENMCLPRYGFVRDSDGTVTKFNTSGLYTFPASINDSGSIAGTYDDHGFLRSADGTMTKFDVNGSTSTWPTGINTNGSIAGYWYDSNNVSHGFVRASDGTITTFDVRRSLETSASGISKKGEIAGGYTDDSGFSHGFLRTVSGKFNKFDPLGSVGTGPSSINNGGSITGTWLDSNNAYHGFVRVP